MPGKERLIYVPALEPSPDINDLDIELPQEILDLLGERSLSLAATASRSERDDEKHHGLSPLLQISGFGPGFGCPWQHRHTMTMLAQDVHKHHDFGG